MKEGILMGEDYVEDVDLYDYHKHNLVYIGDYIKFADVKAGVGITATFTLLAFFGNIVKENIFTSLTIVNIIMAIGLIPLIIASICFVWKILWPNYNLDSSLYMSWGGIGAFSDSKKYNEKISSLNRIEFIADMGKQNYQLAKVCIEKYKYLKRGFVYLTCGVVIESICWFII